MSVPKQDDFAYSDEAEKVSALLTPLPWARHLIILSQSKRPEDRLLYVNMAVREHWSSRELERQFKIALFERNELDSPKVSPLVTQMQPAASEVFRAKLHGLLAQQKRME